VRTKTARKVVVEDFNQRYPGLGDVLPIKFVWSYRYAGRAIEWEYSSGRKSYEIQFSRTSVWNASRKDMLKIANHELAHVLTYVSDEDESRHHGPYWKKTIRELGYEPSVRAPQLFGEKIMTAACFAANLAIIVWALMR